MGSEDCMNKVEDCQDITTTSSEKMVASVVVETRTEVADKTGSLEPITPDSDRENGDFPVDFDSSPSSVKKVINTAPYSSDTETRDEENGTPITPKEGVFDPFAPGPDYMALAPQCIKHASKSRSIVARRLSFDSSVEQVVEYKGRCSDAVSVSDEEIVEAVYVSLLETIVSKQTEVVLAEISSRDWDSSHCRTPPSATCLNGIADSCPGAPVRLSAKSRKIDPAICRRLQFSP